MAGLLDPKSRVLDTIITSEGRRQMLEGGIKIKYATISDIGYSYDFNTKNQYVTSSISFGLESFQTSNDLIFPITDTSGRIFEYSGDSLLLNAGGILYLSGSKKSTVPSIEKISTVVLDSLKKQQIVSTLDAKRNDKGLSVEPTVVNFNITEDDPFDGEPSVTTLTDADSLFCDKRLSKSLNFKYLPPVQMTNDIISNEIELGRYANFSETNDISYVDFVKNLNNLQYTNIEFSRLTEYNDIVLQVFETTIESTKKLDVIKWGRIGTSPEGGASELYFIGKVYYDEFEVPTFVNLFTLVIE
jgi:hypothetical protein